MSSKVKLFIYILNACFVKQFAYNLDTRTAELITSPTNDSYFGYSILLQKGPKGTQPLIIIGAPKNSKRSGGAVYGCSFNNGQCKQYRSFQINNDKTFTGNFLGSVLDGGEFTGSELITCAPRRAILNDNQHFMKGWCVYTKNSTNFDAYDNIFTPTANERVISSYRRINYYNFAFGEVGFDVKLIPSSKSVLYGGPGISAWAGRLVTQSIVNPKVYKVFSNNPHDYNSFLGYSVTTAVHGNPKRIVSVAGSPRGNHLFGQVEIYDNDRQIHILTGQELGSYFGASLSAVDITNDGLDEIIVGAPLGAGNSWEEGYAYVYTSGKNFNKMLTGSKKTASRFGTSISNLGDIDLDGYKDIAISAPYEDDGIGAVYIYMGGKDGVQSNYAQRVSPVNFKGNFRHVKGFGFGMSKGNDIDGNGHNDFAVGAYKSGNVFVLHSLTIIDYTATLSINQSTVKGGDNITGTLCIKYTKRSPTEYTEHIQFSVNIRLDYRTYGNKNFNHTWSVNLGEEQCNSQQVEIMESIVDLEPYKILVNIKPLGDTILGKGVNKIEKFLPYLHGCGNDNICQTNISLTGKGSREEITIGLDKEVSVTINAVNTGEIGYQCQLYLNAPPELQVADKTNCRSQNSTDICSFASRLITTKEMKYKYYVLDQTNFNQEKLNISFKINCLGKNIAEGTGEVSFKLYIENSPYIEGNSDPENLFIRSGDLEDAYATFKFTVGNFGPSPVKLALFLLMPSGEINDDVFHFVEAKGFFKEKNIDCYPSNVTRSYQKNYDAQTVVREPLNRTILLDCFKDGARCLEIQCLSDYYLQKSSEVAEYYLKMKINAASFSEKFKSNLQDKLVAYVASAILYNSTRRIEGHTSVSIYYTSQIISLWIYILAVVLGLILLSAITVILYKCNFFDRRYRDKLKDEKLLDQPVETENSNDDDRGIENIALN